MTNALTIAVVANVILLVELPIDGSMLYAAGNLVDGPDADLIYNPDDGTLLLDASDTSRGVIISFVLDTDQNNMRPENFSYPFGQIADSEVQPFSIGAVDPVNVGLALINTGPILPTGIASPEELQVYFTRAQYASELGVGGAFDLQVVPEGSGALLALAGIVGLVGIRRPLRTAFK